MDTSFKILLLGLLTIACSPREKKLSSSDIEGVYVRSDSFSIIHLETGDTLGLRTIRDTIFIVVKGKQVEIVNHKWKMNDYDQKDWKNMEHADDRPLPTYRADFDAMSKTLSNQDFPLLYIDTGNGKLLTSKDFDGYYKKVD